MSRDFIRRGSIPPEITYIFRDSKEIKNTWDGDDELAINTEIVIPAFPAYGEARLATGRDWAGRGGRTWNDDLGRWEYGDPPEEVTMSNSPIKLRVVGLERRSEGGRAYKVITEDGLYFDLREDVLLETILNCGIEKGGVLCGTYVWAIMHTQMKLIRYESTLYNEMLVAAERGKLKKIPNKDLIPGHIYRTKSGDKKLFLGFAREGGKKRSIWLDDEYWVKDLAEHFNQQILRQNPDIRYSNYRQVSSMSSHSFVEDLGISVDVPENFVEIINEHRLCKRDGRNPKTGLWGTHIIPLTEL